MTRAIIIFELLHIAYLSIFRGRVDDAHLTVLGLLIGWDIVLRVVALVARARWYRGLYEP